jgi:hypothetical protein
MYALESRTTPLSTALLFTMFRDRLRDVILYVFIGFEAKLAPALLLWSAKTTFRHLSPMFANSSQTISDVWYS